MQSILIGLFVWLVASFPLGIMVGKMLAAQSCYSVSPEWVIPKPLPFAVYDPRD